MSEIKMFSQEAQGQNCDQNCHNCPSNCEQNAGNTPKEKSQSESQPAVDVLADEKIETLNHEQLAQLLSHIIPALLMKFHFFKTFIQRIAKINTEEAEKLNPPEKTDSSTNNKKRTKWKSNYQYNPQRIKNYQSQQRTRPSHDDLSEFTLDIYKFIFIAINFQKLAELILPTYCASRATPYHPASMLALWVCFYFHRYDCPSKFYQLVSGRTNFARMIRYFCGFYDDFPAYQTWLDFHHNKLSPEILIQIFHFIFRVMSRGLGLDNMALRIISIDGHLYPSFCKYKQCNRYCEKCEQVSLEGLQEMAQSIRHQINHPHQYRLLNTPLRLYWKCPFDDLWTDKKKEEKIPKVPFAVIEFKRQVPDKLSGQTQAMSNFYPEHCPENAAPEIKLVYLMGLEGLLNANGIRLYLISVTAGALDENDNWQPFPCRRIPVDGVSRMGVSADKTIEGKKRYVFGGDLIIATTHIILLGLEMPAAVTVHYGNQNEHESGKELSEQIKKVWQRGHLGELVKICIKDAGWDVETDYKYYYDQGVANIVGINRRGRTHPKKIRETKIEPAKRIPLAPCDLPMSPNGVDKKRGRSCWACHKICLKYYLKPPRPDCPYAKKEGQLGYVKHFQISDDYTVFGQIQRTSATEKEAKKLRSGSERMNAFCDKLAAARCPMWKNEAIKKWGIFKAIAILILKVWYFLTKINQKLKKAYLAGESWDKLLVRDPKKIPWRLVRYVI